MAIVVATFSWIVISWILICYPAIALEQIIYTNNPFPSLYFLYRVENGSCQFRIQKSSGGNNFSRTNTVTSDFETCFNAFQMEVMDEHPDFEIASVFKVDVGVVGNGVIQTLASLFWLFVYCGVLHLFYTLLPG